LIPCCPVGLFGSSRCLCSSVDIWRTGHPLGLAATPRERAEGSDENPDAHTNDEAVVMGHDTASSA
jgi:hypothetical protein